MEFINPSDPIHEGDAYKGQDINDGDDPNQDPDGQSQQASNYIQPVIGEDRLGNSLPDVKPDEVPPSITSSDKEDF